MVDPQYCKCLWDDILSSLERIRCCLPGRPLAACCAAWPLHALPCYCHAVPCCAVLRHAEPSFFVLYHAEPCCAMLCHAEPCFPCCAMLCWPCCVLTSDFDCVQTLLRKFSIAYWRTPEYNYIRGLVTVTMGFVLGTLYWKIGHHRCVTLQIVAR